MHMRGYGEVRTIQGWECYLEWQENHVSIKGDSVVCKFGSEYTIPLSRCKTPTTVLIEAFTLAAYLTENEPDAYAQHVAKHFIDLVRKPLKLPHNLSQMFEDLSQVFVVTPKRKQNGEESPSAPV